MTTLADKLPRLPGILGRWFSPKRASANEAESGAAQATTGGGSEHEPVVVWTAPHPLEARIVKGRLEAANIPAILQGEVMGDILGLSSGGLAQTDVLVPGPLADKAIALLESDAEIIDEDDIEVESEFKGE